jgi:hypothetical protein
MGGLNLLIKLALAATDPLAAGLRAGALVALAAYVYRTITRTRADADRARRPPWDSP